MEVNFFSSSLWLLSFIPLKKAGLMQVQVNSDAETILRNSKKV